MSDSRSENAQSFDFWGIAPRKRGQYECRTKCVYDCMVWHVPAGYAISTDGSDCRESRDTEQRTNMGTRSPARTRIGSIMKKQEPWPVAQIERRYQFHARHTLKESSDPAASRQHEHVYMVDVLIKHEVNPHLNTAQPWFCIDFPDIDSSVKPVLAQLHNKNLNQVLPCPPTSEAVAYWILAHLPGWADGIRVSESTRSRCEVWRKWIKPRWLEFLRTGEKQWS